MTDLAFVSVAFGDQRYIDQVKRLTQSIFTIYPEASVLSWVNLFPPGAKPHSQSLYGFKVHAIRNAMQRGFKKVIWCDPAMILQKPVNYYFETRLPAVIVVKDDNKLEDFICDKALRYYGNLEIINLHLVGGSLYVFDFNRKDAINVFDHWAKAEADGIFGSQVEAASEQINKHRNDESCMAISLHVNGLVPISHAVAKYCKGENSIFLKKHFK